MIIFKTLSVNDIDLSMFRFFDRTQNVAKCWRKMNDKWIIKDIAFIDNWFKKEYKEVVQYLKNLVDSGGYALGAFCDGKLKGFVSVEPNIFGTNARYMNLSNIHVSRDMRGHGIGKELFESAKIWAKEHNAEKLYISAHSAIESQAFYKAMGCVEAVEYNQYFAEKEPFDCQLEYVLWV